MLVIFTAPAPIRSLAAIHAAVVALTVQSGVRVLGGVGRCVCAHVFGSDAQLRCGNARLRDRDVTVQHSANTCCLRRKRSSRQPKKAPPTCCPVAAWTGQTSVYTMFWLEHSTGAGLWFLAFQTTPALALSFLHSLLHPPSMSDCNARQTYCPMHGRSVVCHSCPIVVPRASERVLQGL